MGKKLLDLDAKKEFSVSDINSALAKAFADHGKENFDDPKDGLMFGVVIGSDIAHRTVKELFKTEFEGDEE